MWSSCSVGNAVHVIAAISLIALAGCVQLDSPRAKAGVSAGGIIVEGTKTETRPGTPAVTTPQSSDIYQDGVVRVDLLLPLGADAAGVQRVANSLLEAAELAERDIGSGQFVMTVRDTFGTADGAAWAAEMALGEGADLILGPLFGHSVREVGPIAAGYGVNVIAFSTDSSVAGGNVFLLSFLPEQEVNRVVEFASNQGLSAYGALTPDSEYGSRVNLAFSDAVQRNGGTVTHATTYPRNPQALLEPVREFAEYGRRAGALKGAIRRAKASGDAAKARRLEQRDTLGKVSYQAAIVPEDANLMRSIAPLFPYFDVNPRDVKLLGTGMWNDKNVFEEPWLKGAWFAAPSPQDRDIFINAYASAYGVAPANPALASLGYDAVALVGALVQAGIPDPFSYETLADPEGFAGVNGIFRFRQDGLSERGLSVMEIGDGAFIEVSAAPRSFGGY